MYTIVHLLNDKRRKKSLKNDIILILRIKEIQKKKNHIRFNVFGDIIASRRSCGLQIIIKNRMLYG